MKQSDKDKLLRICGDLIVEGGLVIESEFRSSGGYRWVERQVFFAWWGKVKSFGHQLGTAAMPWHEMFSENTTGEKNAANSLSRVTSVLGTLEAIKHELEHGYLDTFTQIVRAETLADLLDQAQHLGVQGYHLAAGVIGRAVLEEHLRTTCDTLGCSPSKQRPTINDFNQALYGIQHYSKTKMFQINALTSIGNDAAHNKPDLDANDVKKLILDLPGLIEETCV